MSKKRKKKKQVKDEKEEKEEEKEEEEQREKQEIRNNLQGWSLPITPTICYLSYLKQCLVQCIITSYRPGSPLFVKLGLTTAGPGQHSCLGGR